MRAEPSYLTIPDETLVLESIKQGVFVEYFQKIYREKMKETDAVVAQVNRGVVDE